MRYSDPIIASTVSRPKSVADVPNKKVYVARNLYDTLWYLNFYEAEFNLSSTR